MLNFEYKNNFNCKNDNNYNYKYKIYKTFLYFIILLGWQLNNCGFHS